MTDPWRLDGAVAVVTGASRGLGRGCALELARAGALVVLVARSESGLADAAAEIEAAGGRAHAHPADVADPAQVAALVADAAARGPLRAAVLSAGINRPGPAADYALEDWDALFSVNVRATFLCAQAIGRTLLAAGEPGSIITMSSQLGAVGFPGRAAYCASKHAVEGLTRALAVEWARAGVRVNAVAPTFVDTGLTDDLRNPTFLEEVVERRLPMGRIATVADVAHAARYLATPASASVTGHVLRVDGGWTAW